VVAGGLPSTSIAGFTAFGLQSTNPQWQDPSLLDPKVNFTWVKGNHSLKFGYEYEHIWMAVNDNNPLYGSFTFAKGYSADGSTVSDTYWADFLFGTTSAYSLANYFVAHLRQNQSAAYAQDDWRVSPQLTLNLGLRWEYGSPYSEEHHFISNFNPISQTVLTITPGAVAGNGSTPVSPGGVYGKTLMNPDLNDWGPRVGFAYAARPGSLFMVAMESATSTTREPARETSSRSTLHRPSSSRSTSPRRSRRRTSALHFTFASAQRSNLVER
jgi:outer membrane receptor protein involved in Fe transport